VTAPPPDLVLWTVVAANLCYLLLLCLRIAATRRQRRGPAAPPPAAGPGVAQRRVVSKQATSVLVLMSGTAVVYYGALLMWLVAPGILGRPLASTSWAMYGAGLALSVAGLALMGWTYAVFRSWRWRAEIDPGHALMTNGPFQYIRHPIYLSFALFFVGACLLLPYLMFLVHAIASFIVYDYRARTEEGVMLDAFGDDYRRYRDRTSRYVPGLF
jgi:protein-S-isoprenylcysteine O-methyltransferase Ste14